MDIMSIVTVLWFTIKPYLLLIILLLVLLLLSQIIGRAGWKRSTSLSLWLLSFAIAIVAMLMAPMITDSELRYVLTWVDKLSLLAVGIGGFIYSWLLFRPWLIKRK
ncbi:hypothetical protein WG68_02275 [Arsukibacterium ikkense]|uniref:Uncharacterized protein n=1 Tax=Arsukibacterium ikkense TaxID=336831 RepID=A0A0M2V860_9GAMM|nr:hypothetical protein [Arsukibacterium ikkense]KKO46796.1 hypothetical protein WG68_02275 [Arsukibacterium ikkense]